LTLPCFNLEIVMLEHLFSRSLARYTSSPHAADLDAFATMVQSRGMDNRRTERHTRRLLWVLEKSELTANAAFGASQLTEAFRCWPRKGYVGTLRLFRRYLHEQGRLISDEVCEPRFVLKVQHLKRLVDLRGISPATYTYDNWALTDFLTRVLEPDQDPSAITRQTLDNFFRQRRPQLARRTFHHTVHVVRRYLKYAFECGALPEPLHEFDLPQSFRFEQPPRALPISQVQTLLDSIDRSTPTGARDHAMLYLMSGYGLRPGEVAALKRSSIDWKACTLRVVQSKTNSVLVLPLADDTMAVLRDHLRRWPTAPIDDELFSCLCPPMGPMSACAVSARFKVRAQLAGLPIAAASAYALRHTFAMRLLQAGVGMKQIGDLMGHRSLASTSAYLRIQIDMLRDVALNVPVEVKP
jgi:integrase/recombinase XerD